MAHFDIEHSSGKGVAGRLDLSNTETLTVTLGFKPKYLMVSDNTSTTKHFNISIYNSVLTPNGYVYNHTNTSSGYGNALHYVDFSSTLELTGRLMTINNDGFTVYKANGTGHFIEYFAMP